MFGLISFDFFCGDGDMFLEIGYWVFFFFIGDLIFVCFGVRNSFLGDLFKFFFEFELFLIFLVRERFFFFGEFFFGF